ncbi:unnamed protein product [Trichobilharzia regenti]|nr:unnamed protein product [Trichobilharzia regenti]
MDPETSADLMTLLLEKVWKEEKVPVDLKKGYLLKLIKKGDLGQSNHFYELNTLIIVSFMQIIKTPVCGFIDSSCSLYPKLIDQTLTTPLSTSNTSDLSSSSMEQQQQQQRPERNRLWQSVRQSMSKFRSHFIRNNNIRSSTSALLNSRNTSYQQRMRETLITIPIAENGHKNDDGDNNNNSHDSHQTFNTLLHIQSPSYGKSSSPYPMNPVNTLSESQRRLGTDTPSYNQNRRFSHQNIQTHRESQDSTSILTSFPLVIEVSVLVFYHVKALEVRS